MFALLQRGNFPPPGQAGLDSNVIIITLVVGGVIVLIELVIAIFFLLSLSRCLSAVSPENQQMSPGMVWLCLVPLLGEIWLIIVILKLSDSLEAEYRSRSLNHEGDFGKMLGIILFVSVYVCPCITLVPFIMYWMKIAGFTRELHESATRRDRD